MKPELPSGKENFKREIFEVSLMDSELKFRFLKTQLENAILADRIFESEKTGLLFFEGKRTWITMRPLEETTKAKNPVRFTWYLGADCFHMEGLFACPDPYEKLIHQPVKQLYEVTPKELWGISKFDRFIWSEQQEIADREVKH